MQGTTESYEGMRNLISILLAIVVLCGCGPKVYDFDTLICLEEPGPGDLYCLTKEGHPITGVANSYYEIGTIKSSVILKDGKPDGPFLMYYENGTLKVECLYDNGKAVGYLKGYYENGTRYYKMPYTDSKEDGVQFWYYENGDLKSEITKKDGVILSSECWNEDGNKIPCED